MDGPNSHLCVYAPYVVLQVGFPVVKLSSFYLQSYQLQCRQLAEAQSLTKTLEVRLLGLNEYAMHMASADGKVSPAGTLDSLKY